MKKGYALVYGLSSGKYESYNGTVYLLKDDNHYFTDEEVYKAPKEKVFRKVGIYSYTTRGGKIFRTEIPPEKKTVAIIQLYNK